MKRALGLLILMLPLVGCASAPFVRGVKEYAPDVARELRTYAEADSAIDTATKADRLAAAQSLDDAARASPVTLDVVEAAWGSVREPYTSYVDADGQLDAFEKTLRADNVARFDALLASERRRWIYGR